MADQSETVALKGPCLACGGSIETCVRSVMSTDRPCCKGCAHEDAEGPDSGSDVESDR